MAGAPSRGALVPAEGHSSPTGRSRNRLRRGERRARARAAPSRPPCVRVGSKPGRVTAAPVLGASLSPAFDAAAMDGIAVRAADTAGAKRRRRSCCRRRSSRRGYGRSPPERLRRRHHARARAPDGAAPSMAAVPPWQHVRSIGEDVAAAELLLPGPPAAAGRCRAAGAAGAPELVVRRAPARRDHADGRRDPPDRAGLGRARSSTSTGSCSQARRARWAARRGTCPSCRDDPLRSPRRCATRRRGRPGARLAGSMPPATTTPPPSSTPTGPLVVHGVAVARVTPSCSAPSTARRCWACRLPGLGRPTFEIFAAPLLAGLRAPRHAAAACAARLARKLASPIGSDDWVRVRLGRSATTSWPRRCLAARRADSLVRADGLLVVPAASRGTTPARSVEVELLRARGDRPHVVAVGSHDLVLDLAASRCASATRESRWPRPTSAARWASWRCATGSAPRRLPPARPRDRRVHPALVDQLLDGADLP